MMGREDLPSVYGLFNFLLGIGIVTVPVITGSLVDSFGTFRAPFRFFAVAQVRLKDFNGVFGSALDSPVSHMGLGFGELKPFLLFQ